MIWNEIGILHRGLHPRQSTGAVVAALVDGPVAVVAVKSDSIRGQLTGAETRVSSGADLSLLGERSIYQLLALLRIQLLPCNYGLAPAHDFDGRSGNIYGVPISRTDKTSRRTY